jgi:cysteine desulfurase
MFSIYTILIMKSMRKIKGKGGIVYLDYAASTTPNPGSIHALGVEAKKELELGRKEVAEVLHGKGEEVIFTSGGTESNNLAIQGVVFAWREKNPGRLPHLITTNIEHPSVLEACKLLKKRKFAEISIVPVEKSGIVDPKKIKKEIKKNTILVSVMYANNEIGTIQPIREIVKEIRHSKKQSNLENIYFHTDAVQAVNYLDLNLEKLGIDMLTLSGSKIEGSGRVGVLYKRNRVPLANIFAGGDQEGGLRPGTENLSEILKFSDALKAAESIKEKEIKRLTTLRDYFFKKLQGKGIEINGDINDRLPNNISITIPKIPGDLLVLELSRRGIMSASKSACKEGDGKASHVIEAVRGAGNIEDGVVRLSMGRATSKKDIDFTLKALFEILNKLKKWYY